MKKRWFSSLATGLFIASLAAAVTLEAVRAQDAKAKSQERVQIHGNEVELVEVKAGAEKCPNQKDSTTVRLKVNSESAVDVRLYVKKPGGKWSDRDFPNRKRGDEITDYICLPNAQYHVYTRPAGGNSSWPKP